MLLTQSTKTLAYFEHFLRFEVSPKFTFELRAVSDEDSVLTEDELPCRIADFLSSSEAGASKLAGTNATWKTLLNFDINSIGASSRVSTGLIFIGVLARFSTFFYFFECLRRPFLPISTVLKCLCVGHAATFLKNFRRFTIYLKNTVIASNTYIILVFIIDKV